MITRILSLPIVILLLLVPLGATGFGLGILYQTSQELILWSKMQNWVETEALIEEARVRNTRGKDGTLSSHVGISVRFHYTVDGLEFAGHRISVSGERNHYRRSDGHALVRELNQARANGQPVQAWYDPQRPERARLDNSLPALELTLTGFVFGALLLTVGALALGSVASNMAIRRRVRAKGAANVDPRLMSHPDPTAYQAPFLIGVILSTLGGGYFLLAVLSLRIPLPYKEFFNYSGGATFVLAVLVAIIALTQGLAWLKKYRFEKEQYFDNDHSFGDLKIDLTEVIEDDRKWIKGAIELPASKGSDSFSLVAKLDCRGALPPNASEGPWIREVFWEKRQQLKCETDVSGKTDALRVYFKIDISDVSLPQQFRDRGFVRWPLHLTGNVGSRTLDRLWPSLPLARPGTTQRDTR